MLVQHLAPQHDSVLPELLASHSNVPVTQAADGMRVEPNHVYVIPPNVYMQMHNGALKLTPRPADSSHFMPIDFFFRSLAAHAQSRPIGVVLSGTASDGAVGLRDIKDAGGIVFAQEPNSAKYDGMPRSAIATGVVDRVLPAQDIAAELVRIAHHPLLLHPWPVSTSARSPPLADSQRQRIFALLRATSGVDFTNYKQPTIQRRIQRRMLLHKITTLDGYVKFLEENPSEVTGLYQDILIHVTRFFRDPDSFKAMQTRIFPKIAEYRDLRTPIRIWVPGCSTGEEAYSVTIAMLEFLDERHQAEPPLQVFGTDISNMAVERARAGVYPESIAADVSSERLRRFFTRTDSHYRIGKSVRDLCIFARQDLTRDPPFSKLDLIVCRNVLIYLGLVLQKRLMTVFHYALKPTGFLVLGNAETIGAHADLFSVVDKKARIYAAKPMVIPGSMGPSSARQIQPPHEMTRRPAAQPRALGGVLAETNRILLSRFAPPAVIVDNDLQIVQSRGQTLGSGFLRN